MIATRRIQNTMPTRAQSIRCATFESLMIGEYACCCLDAMIPTMMTATTDATYASSTARGDTPASHNMVVVVSPTTEPAPPAFDAATMPAK